MPPDAPEPSIDLSGFVHHEKKQSIGPIVGTVIVVILLLAGALYFWGAHLNQQAQPAPYIPSGTTTVEVASTSSQ